MRAARRQGADPRHPQDAARAAALEKAAVRAGGGFNHRECLSDAVLIKDNHLAHLDLRQAVDRAGPAGRGGPSRSSATRSEQVAEAAVAQADLILLDNMSPEQVREAVVARRRHGAAEVSGGVTLETVGAYAEAGVDFISVGAITHSAPALDIALDLD